MIYRNLEGSVRRILGSTRQRLRQATLGYDEWSYWRSRSDPNASKGWDETTLRRDVDYIREQARDCREILELGPGVGRTLSAHEPGARITCYDITDSYRSRLLGRARELGLDLTFDVAREPDEPLPYRDAAFDAAVASQVLLHQRPERIERVMAELLRVADKTIAITSYGGCGGASQRPAAHAFHHDYPGVCERIGGEMNHVRVSEGRLYFVCRRLPAASSPAGGRAASTALPEGREASGHEGG